MQSSRCGRNEKPRRWGSRYASAARASGLLLSMLSIGTAHAAAPDSLKCHRLARTAVAEDVLDLDATALGFSDHDCRVKSRVQLFCVPATVTASRPTDIEGPALSSSYDCYKVRCPGRPSPAKVIDRFVPAGQSQTNYRTELVCVPAQTRLPCQSTAPTACAEGECPNGSGQCTLTATGSCGCVPIPCANAAPDACGNGGCPQGEECALAPNFGCVCRPATCGNGHEGPQCAASCGTDPTLHCVMADDSPDCHCTRTP